MTMTKIERLTDIYERNKQVSIVVLMEIAYQLALDDLAHELSAVMEDSIEDEDQSFIEGLERALYEIDILS